MYRIDDPSASATLPVPEAALTEGYWTEGNPGSGILATLERASWFNMVQEELRAIPVAAGLTPSKTTYNQILTALKSMFSPIVGTARNLKASCLANATTIAFSADQVSVETALNGTPFVLPSFNKTLNLATTGAGGMDTGTATAGGWLAVYAIFNPQAAVFNGSISGTTLTASSVSSGALAVGQVVQGAAPGTAITALGTGTGGAGTYTVSVSQTLASASLTASAAALLGTMEAASAAPTIYGGVNMPSGYTASALLAVIPVSSTTGQLKGCLVNGRRISVPQLLTLQTSTTQSTFTSFSLTGAIPKAAVRVSGETQLVSTATSQIGMALACDGAQNLGYQNVSGSGGTAYTGDWAIDIMTIQTLYYTFSNTAGTPTMSLYISAYEI